MREREINVLLVNIDMQSGLADMIPYLFQVGSTIGIIKVKTIERSQMNEIGDSDVINYLMIDPVVGFEIDDDLRAMVEDRINSGSKVIVFTTSGPEEISDHVFEKIGVRSIIRMPSAFDSIRKKIFE